MSDQEKITSIGSKHPKLPLVIVNPHSAGGETRLQWASIASDLRAHFGPFQVAFTKREGEGIEIAKNAAENGRRFIIACGGDGTVNEVLNGIMSSGEEETEMGIMPSGTGGDFRRTISMPSESREAAKALRNGNTQKVDVGRVFFTDKSGENHSRFFLNVSSIGLAANINRRVASNSFFKWIPLGNTFRGKAKFAYSTILEVLELQSVNIRVKMGSEQWHTLQTLNFCVCNARFFGGGMKVAPSAKITDGEFDVVNIGDLNTATILFKGYKLYNGSHINLPEVKTKLVSKLELEPAEPGAKVGIEMDGELTGFLPARYELLPKVLKMRIPATTVL